MNDPIMDDEDAIVAMAAYADADRDARRALAHADRARIRLEAYAVRRRDATGDKTLELPNGTVRTRSVRPQPRVTDHDGLVAWCADNAPELLTVDRDALARAAAVEDVPARVLLTCACIIDVPPLHADVAGAVRVAHRMYAVGSAMRCPNHGDDALIGRWTDTRAVVVADGSVVPGVEMSLPGVMATVTPTKQVRYPAGAMTP